MDLEFGGTWPPVSLIGATVWNGSHGVALRGLFRPGETFWVQETMYRFRTSSEPVDIDLGVGVWSAGRDLGALTLDLLVGTRVFGRFGMKAGLGYVVAFEGLGQVVVFKAMGVVALGGR